jgi:hypothetical protein
MVPRPLDQQRGRCKHRYGYVLRATIFFGKTTDDEVNQAA